MTTTLADGRSGGNQLVVGPLQGHELVVRALLHQEAAGHDGDDVRVLDGGQAVGDDDAGPALSGFVQRLLYRLVDVEGKDTCVKRATLTNEPRNYGNFTILR